MSDSSRLAEVARDSIPRTSWTRFDRFLRGPPTDETRSTGSFIETSLIISLFILISPAYRVIVGVLVESKGVVNAILAPFFENPSNLSEENNVF